MHICTHMHARTHTHTVTHSHSTRVCRECGMLPDAEIRYAHIYILCTPYVHIYKHTVQEGNDLEPADPTSGKWKDWVKKQFKV